VGIGGSSIGLLLFQVFEDVLDHRWVFNAGDDFDVAATVLALLDINSEDPLQPLHPGHGLM
jgi:hypothetical protein